MRRFHREVAIIAAVAFAPLLSACGSGSAGTADTSPSPSHAGLQGLPIRPMKPAPPLELRDYTGSRVNLKALRGKATLVTFVYTHCPDVCPVIVSNLAEAQRELGARARQVQIVAVTVDPKNDTAVAVKKFLAERGATGRMDYLIGSRNELQAVWKAWGIGVSVNNYEDTEGHSALLFAITPAGKIDEVFSSDFTPQQIVHDVPLLYRG
jgi:protein SCO1